MNRVLKSRLRRQVLVSTKDGAAFRGVLYERDREAIVLRSVTQVDVSEAKQITADGEIVIFIADIAYLQFV